MRARFQVVGWITRADGKRDVVLQLIAEDGTVHEKRLSEEYFRKNRKEVIKVMKRELKEKILKARRRKHTYEEVIELGEL